MAAPLFAKEEAALARAVEKRRREFATVRLCARRALVRLGVEPAPIVPGRRGVPQWPSGVVGSMTHCDGYRAAAVARAAEFLAIGIDAEPNQPLPPGVAEAVARPEEVAAVGDLTRAVPGVSFDRLLFCAKEAVFKACFPLSGREIDFTDALVSFDPAAHTFQATLLTPTPPAPTVLSGSWTAARGLLLTAVAVPLPGAT